MHLPTPITINTGHYSFAVNGKETKLRIKRGSPKLWGVILTGFAFYVLQKLDLCPRQNLVDPNCDQL